MKISLGFSPCPNDTFIFDALVHHKIDTEGLEFEVILGDVEDLNKKAFAGLLDMTKLSYHAYAYLTPTYQLLKSGSALGKNCGPLLIAQSDLSNKEINDGPIAIPGKYTTANFLLSLAYPSAVHKREMLFSDIEGAVLTQEVKAGLIIHENRFTYQDKGLVKVRDLGEFWEELTGLPIPLGGIVVKRNMEQALKEKIERVLQKSVQFALQNPQQTLAYVKPHAQEMDEQVMLQHINLYVNDYTVDLGVEGKKAVQFLFSRAQILNLIPKVAENIFV